jgi:hypothetical protein
VTTHATEAAEVERVAASVAQAGRGSVAALVFFGSRKTRARTDQYSAYDLFLLAHDYSSLYRSLQASGSVHRPAWLLAGLNAVLPPNVISIRPPHGSAEAWRAKCAVATVERFLRETSPARHDHFILGRMFQPAEVVYAADAATRERVLAALAGARALTYTWVRPWLPARFDVETYCRTLLRVSLGGEIRPEPSGRADALWEVQREFLLATYGRLLADLAGSGELVEQAGGYSLARPVTAAERRHGLRYFRWSMIRATARWAKYIVTFDGWLEYITRKARRHSGQDIVLTARERRLPLVFLWPRVIRYLRHKDRQGRGA